MEHASLTSIREGADVAARYGAVQEAHRGETMRAPNEGHKLAAKKIPAVYSNERQKLRLACGVAKRFQRLDALVDSAQRRSLSAKRESCGVPPRVLPDLPP